MSFGSANTAKSRSTTYIIILYSSRQSHYREVPRWEISIKSIWAGFEPVGNTEKKWANYEQLLRMVFIVFRGQKKN